MNSSNIATLVGSIVLASKPSKDFCIGGKRTGDAILILVAFLAGLLGTICSTTGTGAVETAILGDSAAEADEPDLFDFRYVRLRLRRSDELGINAAGGVLGRKATVGRFAGGEV